MLCHIIFNIRFNVIPKVDNNTDQSKQDTISLTLLIVSTKFNNLKH